MPDVRSSLPDVERDLGSALPPIAAVDFGDRVLEREPRQALGHRRLREQRDVRPSLGHLAWTENHLRLRGSLARP